MSGLTPSGSKACCDLEMTPQTNNSLKMDLNNYYVRKQQFIKQIKHLYYYNTVIKKTLKNMKKVSIPIKN